MNPMRSTVPVALAVGLLWGTAAGAQRPFPANPQVDRIFAEWDRKDSPGCTVGALRDGRFVYQRGYGMANLDYDLPNSPAMVYYVGSDSKQFVAAAVGLLALEGRLSLDDDIRKHFPEMPAYERPITVRQLIHHTSGIRDVYTLMALGGMRMEDVFTDQQALSLIARQKAPNFTPGSEYLYSNSGYFLLAQLVKRVSGKSLREFTDERLFAPLGMTRSHFHDDPGHVMKQRAMSYEPDGHGSYRISYLQNFDKVGGGGLYTTLDDLAKWDENFYTKQVGGDALQRLIHTRGVLTGGDTLPYAFGNNITSYRGLRTTEHGGALMGYKAYVLRFPDQHFSVLTLCNLGTIDPGPLAHAVAEVYLGDRMGPPPARSTRAAQRSASSEAGAPTGAVDALVGEYYSEELDATHRIRIVDGRPMLEVRNTPPQSLVAAGPDSYRVGPMTLRVERGATGVGAYSVDAGRVRGIRFVRR
jgi:CubicO group peptidase (beta-lactamase class C family)